MSINDNLVLHAVNRNPVVLVVAVQVHIAVAVFIPAAAQVYNQPYLAQYSGSARRW